MRTGEAGLHHPYLPGPLLSRRAPTCDCARAGPAASERGAARRASFVSRDGRASPGPPPAAARTQPSVPSERPAQILSHRYHTLISRQALKPRTELFARPGARVCVCGHLHLHLHLSNALLDEGGACTSRPSGGPRCVTGQAAGGSSGSQSIWRYQRGREAHYAGAAREMEGLVGSGHGVGATQRWVVMGY